MDELFKLMQLLVARHSDQTEQEEAEIASFRRGTLSSYLQGLDGRSCWATLISAFRYNIYLIIFFFYFYIHINLKQKLKYLYIYCLCIIN